MGTETGPRDELAVTGLRLRLCCRDADLIGPLDLHLRRGRVLGLVGPSGCGKSLTCRALLGLLPPGVVQRSGRFRMGEEEQAVPPAAWRGRKLAAVFQNPTGCFDPVFTVASHFRETLAAHGQNPASCSDKIHAGLREVGFDDPRGILDHYPFQLSGGMLQRVMIALALLLDPPFLLADEPTTDLDLVSQARVLDLLAELCRIRNLGILLVTHDLSVVARLAHDMAVMHQGRIVERGEVGAVFATAAHPFTRGLLAAHRRLYAHSTAEVA